MPSSICKAVGLLALVTLLDPANAQSPASVPDTIEGHLAAGKNAAGGRDNTPDFYGLVTAICVAPQRGAPRPTPLPRAKIQIARRPICSRRRPSTTSTGWGPKASRRGC